MDGDSGDDGKDELKIGREGWEECMEGEWLSEVNWMKQPVSKQQVFQSSP